MENKVKTTKKEINGAVYTVNEAKKAVTCMIVSKGEKIYGYSKCGPRDVFDVERGKEIAAYRCEIAQRKRDLRNTEVFHHRNILLRVFSEAISSIRDRNSSDHLPHYHTGGGRSIERFCSAFHGNGNFTCA